MSYTAAGLWQCECGTAAADHLECGDPCCSRCSHPTWTENGPVWEGQAPGPAAASAENALGILPEHNGGIVASGLPPQVSPLKRRALPELAEMADPWDDR